MTITQLVEQAESLAERAIARRQEKDAATGSAFVKEAVRQCLIIAEQSGLSQPESERAAVAVWLYFTALERGMLFTSRQERVLGSVRLLEELELPEEERRQIRRAVVAAVNSEPADLFEETVCDAVNSIILQADQLIDFSQQELLLYQALAGAKVGWLRLLREQLGRLRFFTDYGRSHFNDKRDTFLEKLNTYQKAMRREHREELMREFNLSKKDLKQLKKLGRRDDRGVQTLFRLTSRNHFTLNAMVDRKANIMISINAIILSVMIGGLVGGLSEAWEIRIWPIILLILTSALSIIFAVFSIRPEVSHGEFSREELRAKKGNLLFYGNFLKVSLKDFEREMLQLLNDRHYLYLSMIRDIYFLGETLNKKNRLLRISLNIFLVGIILAVLLLGGIELLGD